MAAMFTSALVIMVSTSAPTLKTLTLRKVHWKRRK
jgi:hypothetical protein